MAEENVNLLLKEANSFLNKGDAEKALAVFKKALESEPDNISIKYSISGCLFKQKKISEAVKYLLDTAKKAKESKDFSEAAKIYKDFLSFDLSKPQSALIDKETVKTASDSINKCIKENLVEILLNLGEIYLKSEEIPAAIDLFSRAIETEPNNWKIHSLLGLAYFKEKKFKPAQGEFQEIIRLEPKESAFAYQMLGDIGQELKESVPNILSHYQKAVDLYLESSRFDESIEICRKILKLSADNTEVIYKLGSIYAKLQKTAEAADVFKKLIEVYIKKGQLDKVIVVYEKMLEYEPSNQEIVAKLNKIYREILNKDPSNLTARHRLIENLLTLGKTSEVLPEFLSLADNYLKNNMLEESYNICQKVLKLDPNYGEARQLLGEIFYKKGKIEESLEEFLKAANCFTDQNNANKFEEVSLILKERFPAEKKSRLQLVLSCIHKGELDTAQKEIEKNLKEAPQDIAFLKLQAEIFHKKNELEPVISTYQKILQIDPAETDIRNKLIEGYLNLGWLEDAVKESTYLGDIFVQEGKQKEAELLYKNILSFFPSEVNIRYRLSNLYLERQDIAKAIDELLLLLNYYLKNDLELQGIEICRQIIKINPDNFNARYQLAKLAKKARLPEEAVIQYSFLADLLIKNKLLQRAQEIILELLEISPVLIDYRQKLIDLLIKQENFNLAKEHYEILIKYLLKANDLKQAKTAVLKFAALEEDNLTLKKKISDIFLEAGFFAESLNILVEILNSYETRKDLTSCLHIVGQVFKLLKDLGDFERYWNLREKVAFWYKDLGQAQKASEELYQVLEGRLRGDFINESTKNILENLISWQSKNLLDLQDKLYTLAVDLYKDKQTKSALIIFDKLESLYLKDGNLQKYLEVLDKISDVYIQINQPEKSLMTQDKKLDVYLQLNDPDSMIKVLFSQVEILSSSENLERLKEIYNKIVKIKEDDSIRMRMGNVYFELGFHKEAEPLYDKVLETDAKNIEATTRLAIINIKLGNLEKAKLLAKHLFSKGRIYLIVEEYKKALRLEFDEINTHLNLGIFFKEMGFFQDAIYEFKHILKDKEKVILGGRLIGDCFSEQGFVDLAIHQYQKVLDLSGFAEEDYLKARYELAKLYEQVKNYKEALIHYQECYAVDIKYQDAAKKIEEINEIMSKEQ